MSLEKQPYNPFTNPHPHIDTSNDEALARALQEETVSPTIPSLSEEPLDTSSDAILAQILSQSSPTHSDIHHVSIASTSSDIQHNPPTYEMVLDNQLEIPRHPSTVSSRSSLSSIYSNTSHTSHRSTSNTKILYKSVIGADTFLSDEIDIYRLESLQNLTLFYKNNSLLYTIKKESNQVLTQDSIIVCSIQKRGFYKIKYEFTLNGQLYAWKSDGPHSHLKTYPDKKIIARDSHDSIKFYDFQVNLGSNLNACLAAWTIFKELKQ